MSTLHITRGIPAAGKSTWARAWVAESPTTRVRVNRDNLRDMLFGARHGLTFDQESTVTSASHSLVRASLRRELDVVTDDMNLRPKYVREWRKVAVECGAGFEVHEFPIDVAEAVARDAQREHQVGEDVLRHIVGKYTRKGEFLPVLDEEVPAAPRPYAAPEGKPAAVLVDIDGTLARMVTRGPYDLDRVDEDEPVEAIVELVNTLRGQHQVIFLSGREDTARPATEEWLEKHVDRTNDEPVHMRAASDKRRDSIVKAELFDAHVRDHYNVRLVLDDRDQVVKMWRDLGLTCLQVAEGAF